MLDEHAVKAVRAPDVVERVTREGAEAAGSSPEAFRATIVADTALLGQGDPCDGYPRGTTRRA